MRLIWKGQERECEAGEERLILFQERQHGLRRLLSTGNRAVDAARLGILPREKQALRRQRILRQRREDPRLLPELGKGHAKRADLA